MTSVTRSAGKSEPVWPNFKPIGDSVLGTKEMSPEVTLIEFISTSASLHGVHKQPLHSLEWDLLKVFPYNIMPANAAAWYMAKRKFYADQPPNMQLLPFLLNKYPDKFNVTKYHVEFLEKYAKETARRKLNYLVQYGLDAYFSHKMNEYEVYFFDPNYYERTEPFHEALRMCTRGNKFKLVQAYFQQNKKNYNFQFHTPNLASVSKQPGHEVITGTTGVIVSMVNNQYGYIKFRGGDEKALFCSKALFRDGWQYSGDPLRLPPIEFDAFKVRSGGIESADGEVCTWIATLVWRGKRPAPKFYSNMQDFCHIPEELIKPRSRLRQPSSGMVIGPVLSIRKNGAIVGVRDDTSQEKVFIPGWSKEYKNRSGAFLTTLTGYTLGTRDLVAYYIDPNEPIPAGVNVTHVGKSVIVLKEFKEMEGEKRRRKRGSVSLSSGAEYEPLSAPEQTEDDADSQASDETDMDSVCDSELEWLEKDLDDIMAKDGPDSKIRTMFDKVKCDLSTIIADRCKGKSPGRRSRQDSGLGGSSQTTPKEKLAPLKVGKGESGEKAFLRTKLAFATVENDYRSSDDEDYKSGDELPALGPRRRRRQSTISNISSSTNVSRVGRNKRSEVTVMRSEVELLPYWVRAISGPDQFDVESGLFLPLDKGYNEEKDKDYYLPSLTDEDSAYEEEAEEEAGEDKAEGAEAAPEAVEGVAAEKEKEDEKELEEELKLLLEEAEKEIDEALLEGKHRAEGPQMKSPEKIIVTEDGGNDDKPKEEVKIDPPSTAPKFKIWYENSYLRFAQYIEEDLPSDVESSVDEEYVPPAFILEEELDYEEYDPEEELESGEVAGLEEDMKLEIKTLQPNMIPIWVPVDTVKARKERAIEEREAAEKLLKEKEAALAAAKEKEAALAAAKEKKAAENETTAAKADASENKTGEEGATGEKTDSSSEPKPQRANSAGKVTRAKIDAETKDRKKSTDSTKERKASGDSAAKERKKSTDSAKENGSGSPKKSPAGSPKANQESK